MALGIITYFVMLIVLKETYIYTFLGKLKERIFKRVESKS
jgi:hypothetical protein